MSKITRQYSNPNNGGLEQVSRSGDRFFINSCPSGKWLGWQEVARSQIESCMNYTKAPEDVKKEILH